MARGRQKTKNPATARRILTAAEALFAEKGFTGARTEQIAAAARANKALLYYYFGSKEKLHRAVLENLFDALQVAVSSAPAKDSSPREQLLARVNGYFDFVASSPNYPRLVQREVMDCGRHLEWIVRRYFRPLHQRFSQTIEKGISIGQFRPVDSHQTVCTIIGMTVFYFAAAPVLSGVLGRDTLRPAAIADRKRAVLDFLEHGLFRPEGSRAAERKARSR